LHTAKNELKLGFTVLPVWSICSHVLAHSSLKETKLRWHLETEHAKYAEEELTFFQKESQPRN